MRHLKQTTAVATLLRAAKRIAVIGLSPKPTRPSHRVALALMAAGYEVIPVNPGHEEILGLRCYPSLSAVPQPVDIVDIFRQPQEVPSIVEQAIASGARAVWMQSGIVHPEAAARAEAAGLLVVMDRCLAVVVGGS